MWVRVDEATGRRLQDLVEVRSVTGGRRTTITGRPYYVVRIAATGEVANVWSDELRRFDVVG